MKIGILGATSQIAKDTIVLFNQDTDYELFLFGRNSSVIDEWVEIRNLNNLLLSSHEYDSFSNTQSYDVIINFVGVGDPAKAALMGESILEITFKYDKLVLDYLKENPRAKYLFLSSGAVYGGNFKKPASKGSHSKININNLGCQDWYSVSKIYAEALHRAYSGLNIVDIRVFNYFSAEQDLQSRFLLTDIARSIVDNICLTTNSQNIVRDYITPPDFFRLLCAVIESGAGNYPVDCYTKAPVDKFYMLATLQQNFGLKYRVEDNAIQHSATGLKKKYYSINYDALVLGYTPEKSSLTGIIDELNILIGA